MLGRAASAASLSLMAFTSGKDRSKRKAKTALRNRDGGRQANGDGGSVGKMEIADER